MPRIEPTLPKPKQATATAAHDAATPEKRTLTPAAKRYESVMRDFMSYIGETTEFYPEGHTFTDTELSEVTPDNIVRYFTFKLYGDGDVNPSEKPLTGSHHTLDYYKKSISSFMPEREKSWDIATKQGNPTRAKSVNDFIRQIRELEGVDGSSKKRKSVTSKKSPSTLATPYSTGKKPRFVLGQPTATFANNNVGPNSNAIVSSILQKMHLQNSLTIDFFGTISTSIDRYRSTLKEKNQSIMDDIIRLNGSLQQQVNTSVPPAAAAGVASVPPALPVATAVPGVAGQEQNWFYNHPDGSQRRVPSSWTFPSGTLLELYTLWHLGDLENRISPMKTFRTFDVSHCGTRSRTSLSEARCLATALDKEVTKAGRSITPNMSQAELVDLCRLGIKGLDIPLTTPTGRDRDIFRLKWRTLVMATKSNEEEEKGEEKEEAQLTEESEPV